MEIYLVQHAEAKSKEEDPQRSLSDLGARNAKAVAALAARLDLEVSQIRHSGKRRAEQTAVILAEELNPSQGVTSVSGLGPLDEVEPVAVELARSDEPVILVGHLPFMERLVGQLVASNAELPVVKFRNAGLVCLTRGDQHWQVAWTLTSDIAHACKP
jgi:phosphohistidine phosphatase